MKRFLLLTVALCSLRCFAAAEPPAPLLVLVSLDGFRWDYCDKFPEETPHLRALKQNGISARSLIPAYPSNTFPNHYTLVTGLRPSHHGIVNNDFFDAQLGEYFHANRPECVAKSQWWGGEPIWNTAEKQGHVSATAFWVGSETAIEGRRPTYWRVYDKNRTFATRLDEFTQWLQLPPAQRPAVIAFYLEETNSVGHKFGPDSPEIAAAVQEADTRISLLQARVQAAGLEANFVFVSDHGMTAISLDRVLALDDYVDLAKVQIDFEGSVVGLRALDGDVAGLLRRLAPLSHGHAYRTADLPAHLHVSATARNPDVWIVPEEGWEVYTRAKITLYRDKFNRADHGFDPTLPSMQGILIAHGPSFKATGAVVDSVENIHVYNLLCAAAGLHPAPNDGDDRLVRAMLK